MNTLLPNATVNTLADWVETSKDEFYRIIGPQNVSPDPQGRWPYTSVYKTPNGDVRGKVVGFIPDGTALASKRYYVPASSKGVTS